MNNDLNMFNGLKRSFWHYTTFDTLIKIIDNRCLKLNRISEQNDTSEIRRLAKKANDIYTICFANMQTERTSMWILYAGLDKGVSLGIKPTTMKKIISKLEIYGHFNSANQNELLRVDNKNVSLQYDWVYYQTGNNNKKYKYRNRHIDKIIKKDRIPFIKDYPWEDEQEFRIAVTIKNNPGYDCIYIKYPESLIQEFKVRICSMVSQKDNEQFRKKLIKKGINKQSIENSIVDFKIDVYSKSKKYIKENNIK